MCPTHNLAELENEVRPPGSTSHPPTVCAVLELGKAEEHLLQRYLTDTVVFNTVFLFGCLQSAKHLSGRAEELVWMKAPQQITSFLQPQVMFSDIFEKVVIKSASVKEVTASRNLFISPSNRRLKDTDDLHPTCKTVSMHCLTARWSSIATST